MFIKLPRLLIPTEERNTSEEGKVAELFVVGGLPSCL